MKTETHLICFQNFFRKACLKGIIYDCKVCSQSSILKSLFQNALFQKFYSKNSVITVLFWKFHETPKLIIQKWPLRKINNHLKNYERVVKNNKGTGIKSVKPEIENQRNLKLMNLLFIH